MDKSNAQQLTKNVFITIGHKNSHIPMGNKIRTIIFEDETEIQVAKKIRKNFAEHPFHHGYSIDTKPFKPSDLYYGIFDSVKDKEPRIKSENYPEYVIDSSNTMPKEINKNLEFTDSKIYVMNSIDLEEWSK